MTSNREQAARKDEALRLAIDALAGIVLALADPATRRSSTLCEYWGRTTAGHDLRVCVHLRAADRLDAAATSSET